MKNLTEDPDVIEAINRIDDLIKFGNPEGRILFELYKKYLHLDLAERDDLGPYARAVANHIHEVIIYLNRYYDESLKRLSHD